MSNLNSNRIAQTIAPSDVVVVKKLLSDVLVTLPFLTGLTIAERQSLPKINVSNKAFVEDCINQMNNNISFMPAYLNTVEMQKDLTLFHQLDEIRNIAAQVTELIEDTLMLAGSEAFISALVGYRLFGGAAAAGVPGADSIYDQLKERFKNQSEDPEPPTV